MDLKVNERIKKYRLSAFITQDEMAKALGMKRSTYAAKESKGTFDAMLLDRIASILEVDMRVFLSDAPLLPIKGTLGDVQKSPFKKDESNADLFTNNEKELIRLYRNLSGSDKSKIRKLAKELNQK